MKWLPLAALALGLALALPASALLGDNLEEGHTAAMAGDFETAYGLWLPLAEAGNPQAQFNIGLMYRHGFHVDQSDAEAARWWLQASEQGIGRAQTNIAWMFANGVGLDQDLLKAAQWCHRGRANGDESAQGLLLEILVELGNGRAFGAHGMEQDPALGCMWFSIAAEAGSDHAAAQADMICTVLKMKGEIEDLDAMTARCEGSGFRDCE